MTEEARKALIGKYGEKNLRVLELPLDDMGTSHIDVTVRVPDRNTMSQFQKYQDVNPKKAQEILVKQCLLTHKEEVMADDALFFTAVSKLAELIPIREATIKKF